jgi:PHD/YefM family antitoxin component YafN of YafNO toxin-antitoxin module
MKIYTTNEAKTRFGEFIKEAQRQPVRVTQDDRVIGVMVSPQDYEAMRQFYADRLGQTMDRAADSATRAGMTEDKLAELLIDTRK